jgi:hypothetical protein
MCGLGGSSFGDAQWERQTGLGVKRRRSSARGPFCRSAVVSRAQTFFDPRSKPLNHDRLNSRTRALAGGLAQLRRRGSKKFLPKSLRWINSRGGIPGPDAPRGHRTQRKSPRSAGTAMCSLSGFNVSDCDHARIGRSPGTTHRALRLVRRGRGIRSAVRFVPTQTADVMRPLNAT